jgi:hypothetical protein
VAESFATPSACRKAVQEVSEFHRFQDLAAELTVVNEQICRSRPAEPDSAGWTEAEKKRLLLFIKKSHGKSRRFSKWCLRHSGRAPAWTWKPSKWLPALGYTGPGPPY